ncbi:hypothetical protein IV87_GL000381 [Pediococcus ethanolidurans]|uniref:Uncharacterized protein n=1 Tax=Pediococcus ethanolidurans TaxID=319653 RepID=A0A0R2JZ20_9LACO|nr:hypothetical protein IV87_GL000381 [Pediococcus ethanolidurans]
MDFFSPLSFHSMLHVSIIREISYAINSSLQNVAALKCILIFVNKNIEMIRSN